MVSASISSQNTSKFPLKTDYYVRKIVNTSRISLFQIIILQLTIITDTKHIFYINLDKLL